ncbi:MAG: hypothetical protein IPL61_00890 [Myxococcales bacterium]|nr:hypothetical protein [Myxococcales bacterium]
MKLSIALTFVLTATLAACGGDDGPSDSAKIVDLTLAETTSLCQGWAMDMPERTVDCGNGNTSTVGIDPASCSEPTGLPATCELTVGQMRACLTDQFAQSDADICAGTLPASCAPLFACFG